MTSQAALPIAPRPEGDELLSSWQARVACRYGLTHDELSRRLGVLGHKRRSGFIERDFAPSSGAVRAWATACRLSERQIGGMALSSRSRSSSWYVWGDGRSPGTFRRPVCLECLAEDAAAGRDHHFRRTWALVETLICGRHHCPLEEACQHCRSSVGFQFTLHDGAARLACVTCEGMIRGAYIWRCPETRSIFSPLSEAVAPAFHDQPEMAVRIMEVARLLWARPRWRTGRRLPFVVDVFPGLRLSPSVEGWVDPAEPLATAPLGWRVVTLLGVAKLLGLDGPWENRERPLRTISQMLEWTGASMPQLNKNEGLELRSEALTERPPGRSDADYLALAWSIVTSREWSAALGKDRQTRRKAMHALIQKAIAPATRTSP